MHMHLTQAGFVLAMSLAAGAASAAINPQDIEVTGTIKTPTCAVTASEDGEYDYGKINNSLIPTTGHLVLSTKSQTWTVDCGTASTYLGFRVVDNQSGSESTVSATNFGLGKVTGYPGSKIGYFNVGLSNARVDGTARNILRAAPGAASGTAAATGPMDKTLSHTWASGTTSAVPLAGSVFVMDMAVTANIANETLRGAPVTEGTPISGNVILSYSFGL